MPQIFLAGGPIQILAAATKERQFKVFSGFVLNKKLRITDYICHLCPLNLLKALIFL